MILFSRRPPLSDQPLPMPSYSPSSIRGRALEKEFLDLLHKGAIEQAPQTPGFYSRLFVVQKDSGSWRPIIDLSTLNTFIVSQRFHMETPQSVLRSIRQGDWMISLDLQDAYLQVPILPESRLYLRFTMGGVPYQFRVLCFGLATAPQVFTRLMAPISAILHRYGIRILRYLDDWLILAESRTTCIQARDRLLHLCEELGLQVNHKVITGPVSGHDLSRNADTVSSVHCKTNRDKSSEPPQYNRGVSLVPKPPSSSLATSSGPPFVPYPSSEGWDAKNAITPASSRLQVELSRRLPSHFLGSSVPGGSPMVVLGDPTTAGSRSFPTSAGLELLLRCFRRRLGCNNGGTTSVRSMDSKPKANVHQPQRDDGSTERPLRVQPVPQRQDDRPVLRQCHNSRVSQAIGRHEVQSLVPQSKRDPPVGRIYADHDPTPVHPGVSQLESGSPQSSQSGNRLRVDTAPTGSSGSPSPVAGDHRPVCNLAGGKTPSVLCPSVGTQGNGGRCVPPTLGQPPGVCLPSDSHHKESSSQTESLSPLQAHPDRPLLASKGMVSRSSGTSIRHSNRTTQTPRSTATTAFPSVSRKSPNASSDCVATLERFARQAGFSETVAGQLALCRRTSTRLNYQARWGKFRKWCKDSHHRSSEPTIPKIAEFLTFLFRTEKAAVSTIKGYRSMLSSVFKFCLPEISTSPILKDLTRSFEISAPRPIHRSPTWDLDKVLEYLSGPPFEPLADASFRNKTRKALFLLAMATAKRVGELQALSFSVSHRGDDLILHYDPFFLAKTESASNPLPRSVIVQSLEDFVGDLPERVLCPVRAVRHLRRAARSAGATPSRLFVSPSDPTRSMSKNAMSFFLRQLITESGAVSSSVPPRAHAIRGIATSLNYYSNLSLSAINEAATWKSNRVFAMRYLKYMSATRSRLKDKGPLIAAGAAVHQH